VLRFKRQKQIGIFPDSAILPHNEGIPSWSSITNKEEEAEKMAVYSAMIEIMDEGIGRIMAELKKLGIYENTLIIFLSDNGGSSETLESRIKADVKDTLLAKSLPPGPKGSYKAYGGAWASLSNTPFRNYKSTIYEGGIASPLLVKDTKSSKIQFEEDKAIQINYILPELLRIVDIEYPKTWKGEPTPFCHNEEIKNEQHVNSFCWEHEGKRGVRQGNMKLVCLKNKPWELYNLESDPFETKDIYSEMPAYAHELEKIWKKWAGKVGVKL